MSDHRQTLSATGMAFIALGSVAFALGLMSWWMDVRQPIAYGMAIGAGLVLAGIGLIAVTRRAGQAGTPSGPKGDG
ncbi:hypothetical protein [Tautonia sociabilis]|uniref:Uncharacterized protein n=1 Tax=Tautonia sociabilis TaxID=2080755 RepID=A0A432MPD3_9BACT|nr:hypothetical protein [Tautonia sociabilis]RUL88955.1 hypothetical protein TsocGM_04995 [Tautonia sociabilis]